MSVSTVAERMRRYRDRRSRGVLVVPVEVSTDVRDAMVELGLLAQWDSDNAQAVADALAELLARYA